MIDHKVHALFGIGFGYQTFLPSSVPAQSVPAFETHEEREVGCDDLSFLVKGCCKVAQLKAWSINCFALEVKPSFLVEDLLT